MEAWSLVRGEPSEVFNVRIQTNFSKSFNPNYLKRRLDFITSNNDRFRRLDSNSGRVANLDTLEQELGVKFPDDYKTLVSLSGGLELVGNYWFIDLRLDSRTFSAKQQDLLALYSKRRQAGDPACVLETFPVLPGLIAFGGDYESGVVAWLGTTDDNVKVADSNT